MTRQSSILKIFTYHLLFFGLETAFSLELDKPKDDIERVYGLNPMIENLEYGPYTKEVFKILRNNENISRKLADDYEKEGGLKSGNIGDHLDLLPSDHRTRLDELKRMELKRLKQLGEELKKRGGSEAKIRSKIHSFAAHLDLRNLEKFGMEDLRKLTREATGDLERIDTLRRKRFKEYEMHKRLEVEEMRRRMSPEELAESEKTMHKVMHKHRKEKPTFLPMSKAHLVKVWEERDRMSKNNFNTKAFYNLHDLDSNTFLDEDEIKILLQNEVKDLQNLDPKEKQEEIEKMREYVFNHMDKNKDHLLSFEEFVENMKENGMDDSHFWDVLQADTLYTQEEYEAYANENRDEVIEMIRMNKVKWPMAKDVSEDQDQDEEPAMSN